MVSRHRLASLALFVFGVCLTLPELYSNASDLLQNPIGNLMGLSIIATTGLAACGEWFPEKRIARMAAPALVLLAIVASIVMLRFVVVFVPILTPTWAQQNPGVILGFAFSLFALTYIAILCWRHAFTNLASKSG